MSKKEITEPCLEDWMLDYEEEQENMSSFGFDSQADEDAYFDDFEKACNG